MDIYTLSKLLRDKNIVKLVRGTRREDFKISTRVRKALEVDFKIGDGLTLEETKDVIEILNKEGLLKEIIETNTVACPYCESIDVDEMLICPKCHSLNIKKVFIALHVGCGRNFTTESLSVATCPRCGKHIKSRDDIRIIGSLFKCDKCSATFEVPEIIFECKACGNRFSIREALVRKIYKYELREEAENIINLLYLYKKIAEEFEKLGFYVGISEKVVGISGVEHIFPLLIKDVKNNRMYSVDLTGLLDEVSRDYLLKSYILVLDTPDVKHIFLINEKFPDEELSSIPPKDNLVFVKVSDPSQAIDKIKDIISSELNIVRESGSLNETE